MVTIGLRRNRELFDFTILDSSVSTSDAPLPVWNGKIFLLINDIFDHALVVNVAGGIAIFHMNISQVGDNRFQIF